MFFLFFFSIIKAIGDNMNKELIISTYEEDTLLFRENLLGRLENDILKYENDTDSFLIDLNESTMQKENLDSILKITPNQATLSLKEIEKSFEIELKKQIFLKNKNRIIIEYLLESQEKPIKIEIEMSDIDA